MDTSQLIKTVGISLLALFLALYIGIGAATAQTETAIKVFGVVFVLICVFLGQRVWLLMILFGAIGVPFIRGFNTTELGQFAFIGFSILMLLMRRLPLRVKFTELDFWMMAVMSTILQVYLRNPAGLGMFGSDVVGARPYFKAATAFASALILAHLTVRSQDIRWAMRLNIIGALAGLPLTYLRMGALGGEVQQSGTRMITRDAGAGRLGSLVSLSAIMAQTLAAYRSPLRALTHPFWGVVVLLTLALAAGSGYRTSVATVGAIFLTGIAYRGGFTSLLLAVFAGGAALLALAFVNVIAPLPANIQRALSPFPGSWEARYVDQAQESTDWRVEMWKEALFTDKWIENKWLGDGLGFTRAELKRLADLEGGGKGISGLSKQQESMMITGGYHSGPVQTIRTTGYIGLFILVFAMIRLGVHSHRQIIRCRDTDWYPVALFFGIPNIVAPIVFVFVFGDFGTASAAFFIGFAMTKILQNNLPLPAYAPRGRYAYQPMLTRQPRAQSA